MLFIIGGAARAGKTLLARRICNLSDVAYVSTDELIVHLSVTTPELGLNIRDPAGRRSAILWPVVRPIVTQAACAHADFLLEGDALMPAHVTEIDSVSPDMVRACFIGYAEADPYAKLREIRRYAAGREDWTHELDDIALLRLIVELRDFSGHLRRECLARGIAYFDGSSNFCSALRDAERFLKSPLGSADDSLRHPAQSSLRLP